MLPAANASVLARGAFALLRAAYAVKLPLEMGVLSFVQNVDKELSVRSRMITHVLDE